MHHRATSTAPTIAALLARRTREEGDQPLVTCYDDVTGTRTELSYATLDNWAAKTANLLAEEFDVGAGDRVGLDLDGHWTAAAVLLACWKIGAAARYGQPSDDVDVVCCHEAHLSRHTDRPALVVGDGLAAESTTDRQPGDEHLLLADEVHAFADDYDETDVTPDTAAVVTDEGPLSHRELLVRADHRLGTLGDAARIGMVFGLDEPPGAELLVTALLGGGGLVCTRGGHDAVRWDRMTTERVTVVTGPAARLEAAGPAPSIATVPAER
jgi:uncharacterized protein (TIGR03089 family)